MARTSKMNMIMHGDGHGGVHHHDGFFNVNGIFEERFDIILTNPPFGANVEPSDVVHESDTACQPRSRQALRERIRRSLHGRDSARSAAINKPIASLFELPKGEKSKVKTEILFIERCLALLNPAVASASSSPKASSTIPRSPMCASSARTAPSFAPWSACRRRRSFRPEPASRRRCCFVQKFTDRRTGRLRCQASKARTEIEANMQRPRRPKKRKGWKTPSLAATKGTTDQRKALQKEFTDYRKRMAEDIVCGGARPAKGAFPVPIFSL